MWIPTSLRVTLCNAFTDIDFGVLKVSPLSVESAARQPAPRLRRLPPSRHPLDDPQVATTCLLRARRRSSKTRPPACLQDVLWTSAPLRHLRFTLPVRCHRRRTLRLLRGRPRGHRRGCDVLLTLPVRCHRRRALRLPRGSLDGSVDVAATSACSPCRSGAIDVVLSGCFPDLDGSVDVAATSCSPSRSRCHRRRALRTVSRTSTGTVDAMAATSCHLAGPMPSTSCSPVASRMFTGASTWLRRLVHLAGPVPSTSCSPVASRTSTGASTWLRRLAHLAGPVPSTSSSPVASRASPGPSPRLPRLAHPPVECHLRDILDEHRPRSPSRSPLPDHARALVSAVFAEHRDDYHMSYPRSIFASIGNLGTRSRKTEGKIKRSFATLIGVGPRIANVFSVVGHLANSSGGWLTFAPCRGSRRFHRAPG